MEYTPPLAQRVLELLEPDESKRENWQQQMDLYPVSKAECVQAFTRRIQQAAENKEKVFIFGDYDCDGIIATTILTRALHKLGIQSGFYIPNRLKEGYGLNAAMVQMAADKGYDLLITVDNGVKASAALKKARELGLEVIVTDHHVLEDEVNASLLVHPSLMEEPFSSLCGAGVVFELVRSLGLEDAAALQLAATASIGDVMQVTGQTRAMIQQGLASMKQNLDSHLAALEAGQIENEETIAFKIVPKINAVGRLSDKANANNVVRFFLSDNPQAIHSYALQILNINQARKEMSAQMVDYCKRTMDASQPLIFMMDPGFHEGLLGLAAGALCEETGKPALVMTSSQEGCKGSMRSPAGFDCMDFLSGFDHFTAAGGHANAAGISVDYEHYDDFVAYIRQKAAAYEWEKRKKPALEIAPEEISLENIAALNTLRPFGPGFVCPDFILPAPQIKAFRDLQMGKHRKYVLQNGTECLRFNQPSAELTRSVLQISSFLGHMQASTFQGRTSPTFIIDQTTYF